MGLHPILEKTRDFIYTARMKKALLKWNILCGIGMCFLALTAVCFILKKYTPLVVGLVIGLLFTSQSWKRIGLLKNAAKAIENGAASMEIIYKGRNQKEYRFSVIPAGADILYLYGFIPEKSDIKIFRWEQVQRTVENGIDLSKESLLERFGVETGNK